MNIINARSPYFITVNEDAQLGSKIELFIWNNPDSKPVTPTYTFSKKVPSLTQTENTYNISSFINQSIENISVADSVDDIYVNVSVNIYKEFPANTYSLIDTQDFIGVNGYNTFLDGYNKINTNKKIVVLNNNLKKINYNRSVDYPFVNVFIDSALGDKLELNYTDVRGRNLVNTVLLATTDAAVKKMFKIPLTTSSIKFDVQNKLEIKYSISATSEIISLFKIRTLADGANFEAETCLKDSLDLLTDDTIINFNYDVISVCENKYTPVVCSFINKFGGWEFLTFFKTQTNSIDVKSTDYKFTTESINYNPLIGQNKSFNTNGSQVVKLNTGLIDEIDNETIQDLMLSETILLDNKPVILKTKSNLLKTDLNEKIINYTMEFQYAYNLINDIV